MKILCLGDIAGPASCNAVCKILWKIRRFESIDFVVANAENCAECNGIDKESAEKLFICGVDVITTGNHIWKNRTIRPYLDYCNDIIRPYNYPALENGCGYTIKECNEKRILVMNVAGLVFMDENSYSPFQSIEKILTVNEGKYDISILDFHAEATSEKYAIGRYFDGKIDIIFGTHTHVQTADDRILKKSTGYITDLGMCGSEDSVLGIKSDIIISRYLGTEGQKFVFDSNNISLHGAIFETNPDSFGIKSIKRFLLNEKDFNKYNI